LHDQAKAVPGKNKRNDRIVDKRILNGVFMVSLMTVDVRHLTGEES
jgi:hypothetical protein